MNKQFSMGRRAPFSIVPRKLASHIPKSGVVTGAQRLQQNADPVPEPIVRSRICMENVTLYLPTLKVLVVAIRKKVLVVRLSDVLKCGQQTLPLEGHLCELNIIGDCINGIASTANDLTLLTYTGDNISLFHTPDLMRELDRVKTSKLNAVHTIICNSNVEALVCADTRPDHFVALMTSGLVTQVSIIRDIDSNVTGTIPSQIVQGHVTAISYCGEKIMLGFEDGEIRLYDRDGNETDHFSPAQQHPSVQGKSVVGICPLKHSNHVVSFRGDGQDGNNNITCLGLQLLYNSQNKSFSDWWIELMLTETVETMYKTLTSEFGNLSLIWNKGSRKAFVVYSCPIMGLKLVQKILICAADVTDCFSFQVHASDGSMQFVVAVLGADETLTLTYIACTQSYMDELKSITERVTGVEQKVESLEVEFRKAVEAVRADMEAKYDLLNAKYLELDVKANEGKGDDTN